MNLHSHSISSLQGVLTVPGDKSISHRAAILGGLAQGVTEVDNFLCSEDCLNTLRAMEQLGADARHALYVGDSEVDVEMARRAGLPLAAVAWGFRGRALLEQAGARCIVDTVPELLAVATE